MMIKVKFQSNEYYLITGLVDSPIATKEAYENGTASYAHLFPNGQIKRFGEVIGNKKDLEILEEVEDLQPKSFAMANIFTDPSWEGENEW